MKTIDTTWPSSPNMTVGAESFAHVFGRKGEPFDDLVDRVRFWGIEHESAEAQEGDEPSKSPAETVISSAEVTLERLSLTPGQVVISLTDEQAERIKHINEGNALPG